jgi:cell division cycle 14
VVVRLNNVTYDREKFIKNGIKHVDMYFLDGSTPPDNIVEEFLDLAEKEKHGLAVHCKAGLGRTGTLIAAYAMKHYRFPAEAFIGYIRICRPGSVLGPQQQYLCVIFFK